MYNVFRQYVRENIFSPPRILRYMDLHGGVLNYKALEALRSIESEGEPYVRTLIPLTAQMQEGCNIVEKFAKQFCPYVMTHNEKDNAEGFHFRAADVLVLSLLAGNFYDKAYVRSIKVSQSLDGALFTKNLGHTLGGLKFNDRSNPLKQSRNSVFPVVCVCARETKGLVRGLFGRVIKEIEEAAKIVLPNRYGIQPIDVPTNCDMSCVWKISGRGSATGTGTMPCLKCLRRSGELSLPTQDKLGCKWCVLFGHTENESYKCRHIEMFTEEHINKLQVQIEQFQSDTPSIAGRIISIRERSELRLDEDPNQMPTKIQRANLKSIFYDLSRAREDKRREYGRLINQDLRLRQLDLGGSLESRQERLKTQHKAEYTFMKASKSLEDMTNSQKMAAMVMMMDSVPCILHTENRVGLKFLTLVLNVKSPNSSKT